MATAAAAIAARARREVDELFWNNDAFSPDRAVEFEPRMPIQQNYLEQLIGEGIVHEAAPGRYWFDLPRYKEVQRERWVWSMRVLAAGAIVFLVILAIQLIGRTR
jgi:hypothetical protein